MALNNHEKWIRDNVGGMKVNVDSNELWASLESHVPNKKRRGVFFWLFPSVASVIIAVGGLWMYTGEPTVIADKSVSQSVAQVLPPTIEQTNGVKHVPKQDLGINTKSANLNIPREGAVNNIQNEVSFSTPQNTIAAHTRVNKLNSYHLEKAKSTAKLANNNNNNNNNNNSVQNIAELNDISTLVISQNIIQSKEVIEIAISTNQEEGITNELRDIYAFKNLDQSTELDFFPNEMDFETPQPNDIEISKAPRFFASLASGINLYSGNTESSNMGFDYNRFQEAYTNTLPSYYYSLGLEYKINSQWTVVANIRQQNLVDRTMLTYTKTLSEPIDGVTENIIDLQGQILQTNGTVNSYTISEIEGQWHQSTQAFDLQMGAKYKFLQLGRWNSQIGAGITYNFSSNISGSYLSEEGIIEKLASPIQSINETFQPYANFQINYKINKRLSIGLEGQYQQLNNILNTLDTKLISEYHIGNIGLTCQYGIR
ncbi:hypothetical protein N9B82_04275 [Saprospiraceae bacterium]|nr:hypothetical protein [Saprospiraceae bacterium]